MLQNPNTYSYPFAKLGVEAIINMAFRDVNNKHPFYLGKHPVETSNVVFFVKKGAPFSRKFNFNILKLNEAGIFEKFIKDTRHKFNSMGRKIAKLEKREYPQDDKDKIKIKHIKGPYIVCVGLLVCAALVAMIEKVSDDVQMAYFNFVPYTGIKIAANQSSFANGAFRRNSKVIRLSL